VFFPAPHYQTSGVIRIRLVLMYRHSLHSFSFSPTHKLSVLSASAFPTLKPVKCNNSLILTCYKMQPLLARPSHK